MPTVEKWTAFAAGLRNRGMDIFATAQARVPATDLVKILGLLLLARTLSNLKAALILLRENQIVEARAISRCLYENQFWLRALLKDGDKFRKEMVGHEMKHARFRAQELFKDRMGLNQEQVTNLRQWMRENDEYEKAATLIPKDVVKRIKDDTYVFYQLMTLDGHPSLETLGRYYSEKDGAPVIDVQPKATPDEVIQTLNLLCLPVVSIFLVVNEVLTGSPEIPEAIGKVSAEYKRLTEETRGLNLSGD